MRQPRLFAPPSWSSACYHCVSRVVDRQHVLGDEEKAEFLRLMRLYEKLCQVRVLTYCLMSNHFHLLVEVPQRPEGGMSELALLAHIAACHGKARAWRVNEEIRQYRAVGAHAAAQQVIEAWTSRMWDLSAFMKTLKQRFTQWYNKRHGRRGTLWEDRFRSTLVEGNMNALAMVGAYIDLNPVRAGIVDDPKDYRWSGYGAAVAGVKLAVKGLERVLSHEEDMDAYAAHVKAKHHAHDKGTKSNLNLKPSSNSNSESNSASISLRKPLKGQRALARYRLVIYNEGDTGDAATRQMQSRLGKNAKGNRRGFDRAEVLAVRENKGTLTRAQMLHCRVRYFVDGAVLGSRAFVNRVFEEQRHRFGVTRTDGARAMRGADFGGLCTLRDLRKEVFG